MVRIGEICQMFSIAGRLRRCFCFFFSVASSPCGWRQRVQDNSVGGAEGSLRAAAAAVEGGDGRGQTGQNIWHPKLDEFDLQTYVR